nr:hypothetical protein [Tanacetum cinerariifolium]
IVCFSSTEMVFGNVMPPQEIRYMTDYFRNYRVIKGICFKYHEKGQRHALQYMHCCTVEFESAKLVIKVMRARDHEILLRHVDLKIFRRVNNHKHLLEKGKCRLWIKEGLPGEIPKPTERSIRLNHLDIVKL